MVEIGEASRQSGVGIETIRFWEREGIIPRPNRQANNRRQYSAADIGRLRFVRTCRDLGFPPTEARALLDLSMRRDGDCAAVKAMAERQIASIRDRIVALTALEAALVEMSGNCDRGQITCPMLMQLQQV